MAPNTRAATRHIRDPAKPDATRLPANDQNEKAASSRVKKNGSRLLELPPELRNRIYDYAQDSDFQRLFWTYAPRAQKRSQSHSPTQWDQRIWKFLGLAQSCQQLRSEYRPLWIHNLAVRLRPNNFSKFVAAFLPTTKAQKYGPELIQISWQHDRDSVCETRKDIMPFLLAHAYFPNIRFEYVPYRVADLKLGPGEEICDHCYEERYLEGHGDDPDDALGYCTCYDSDMDHEEWIIKEENRMGYIEIVEEVLCNNNEKWIADLKAGHMTVKCTFDPTTELPLFRILCKARLNKESSSFAGTYDLLKACGLFALTSREAMDFVVVYETESKRWIGEYDMTKTMVREVHVPRPGRSRIN